MVLIGDVTLSEYSPYHHNFQHLFFEICQWRIVKLSLFLPQNIFPSNVLKFGKACFRASISPYKIMIFLYVSYHGVVFVYSLRWSPAKRGKSISQPHFLLILKVFSISCLRHFISAPSFIENSILFPCRHSIFPQHIFQKKNSDSRKNAFDIQSTQISGNIQKKDKKRIQVSLEPFNRSSPPWLAKNTDKVKERVMEIVIHTLGKMAQLPAELLEISLMLFNTLELLDLFELLINTIFTNREKQHETLWTKFKNSFQHSIFLSIHL